MANQYYDPGTQRAAKVGDLFAGIAGRYDLLNDLQSFGLHRRWKRRLVQIADPQPGDRALDVCCGTGDIVFALAQAGAETTGLDFSEPMLEVARARAQRESERGLFPVSSPRFVQGDAQQLPFGDQEFNIVTVGYGLRNLASWEKGLQEMWRVAKPGGRLLVLDFGKPETPLWRWLYYAYLRCMVPLLGRVLAGNAPAYAYIFESLKHYPAQQGIAAAMERLPGERIQVIRFLGGVMTINAGCKAQAS